MMSDLRLARLQYAIAKAQYNAVKQSYVDSGTTPILANGGVYGSRFLFWVNVVFWRFNR